jgi:hypothetical protein
MKSRSIQGRDYLGYCREELKLAVASVSELQLKIDQVSVFFQPDMCEEGLGKEIIVRVTELFVGHGRSKEIQDLLSEKLRERILQLFGQQLPNLQLVEVFVHPFNQNKGGYAHWRRHPESQEEDMEEFIIP